jgi:hypothetical protein
MKTKLERFALGLLLAPLAPLAGLMGFWWLSYSILPVKWISIGALTGLFLGILADTFLLKKLLDHAHHLSLVFWVAVLLFYAVGIFGFFMGVPIFNAALAIPAGFVVGGRLAHEVADRSRVHTATLRTCILTTILLAFICAASAFFALISPSTPSDLEGMLGLPFAVTPAMTWSIILVGGAGLLAINWVLTGLSVRLTVRFLSAPEAHGAVLAGGEAERKWL